MPGANLVKLPKSINPIVLRPGASIGSASAESDDEFLFNCFVQHPAVTAAIQIDSPGMILAGRTGSGKTAILRYVEHGEEHIGKIDPFQMSLSYVANSDVLRFLHQIGADLDLLFQVLWKHVLCIEYIRIRYKIRDEQSSKSFFAQLFQRFRGEGRKDRALGYLKEWEGRFWIDMDQNVKEIVQKYESHLQAEIGGEVAKFKTRGQYDRQLSNEKKLELVARARKIINADQLTELSNVIELLSSLSKEDEMMKHYIMIDRLDERWVDDSVRFRLIRALTEALKAFKAIVNLKILVALRSDILERVAQETADLGFQWEKYQDNLIRLRWQKSQLKEVVERRIRFLFERKYTQENIRFSDVFSHNVGLVEPFDYILERTMMRPRDVITFVNECLSKAEGQFEVTGRMIREAEGEYSHIRKRALEQEWQSAFPTLQKFLAVISSKKQLITFEEFKEVITEELAMEVGTDRNYEIDPLAKFAVRMLDGTDKDSDTFAKESLGMLYRVGAVGLKNQAGERYLYSHLDAPIMASATIHEDTRIRIHPMLHRSLSIQV